MIEKTGMYHIDNSGNVKMCAEPDKCLISSLGEHYPTYGEAFDNKDLVLSERFGVLSGVVNEDAVEVFCTVKIEQSDIVKLDNDDISEVIKTIQENISLWILNVTELAKDTELLTNFYEAYNDTFLRINHFNEACNLLSRSNEIIEWLISENDESLTDGLSTYIYNVTPYMLPMNITEGEPDDEVVHVVNKFNPNHKEIVFSVLNATIDYRKSVSKMNETVKELTGYIMVNGHENFVHNFGELRVMYYNMNKLNEELLIRERLANIGYTTTFDYYNGPEFLSDYIRVDDNGKIINVYAVNSYGVVGKVVDVEVDGEGASLIDDDGHRYCYTETKSKVTKDMRVYLDETNGRIFSLPGLLFKSK